MKHRYLAVETAQPAELEWLAGFAEEPVRFRAAEIVAEGYLGRLDPYGQKIKIK